MSINIAASIYTLILFGCSLIAFGWVVKRWLSERETGEIHPLLPPWWLRPIDFGLWIAAMMLWFVLASALAEPLSAFIQNFKEAEAAGILATLLSGILMQLGMLASFLYVRHHFASEAHLDLNPTTRTTKQIIGLGFLSFLAAYPVIVVVNLVWTFITMVLNSIGLGLPEGPQPVVTMLMEREEVWIWPLVFLLAVIIAPIVEEMVFRAGIFRFLQGRFSLVFSVAVSSVLFGLVHGHFLSLPGLTMVGVALAIAYHRTRDIRVPIVFHALFNLNSLLLLKLWPEIAI